jgi:molybdopterin converting factor subunit 1
MQVNVRFFASLREIAGKPSQRLELPDGATVEAAWRALTDAYPALARRRPHVAASVDRRYVDFDEVLHHDSEVVFIPPVSGG